MSLVFSEWVCSPLCLLNWKYTHVYELVSKQQSSIVCIDRFGRVLRCVLHAPGTHVVVLALPHDVPSGSTEACLLPSPLHQIKSFSRQWSMAQSWFSLGKLTSLRWCPPFASSRSLWQLMEVLFLNWEVRCTCLSIGPQRCKSIVFTFPLFFLFMHDLYYATRASINHRV